MKTIYHLAISRLKYNKGRSILTIVAIALMTTLLMSIGSSALTVIRHQQLEIKESARNYHAAFKGSTADQVFILENHADVESLSTRESVASIELPKLNAVLNFDSTKKGSIDQIQLANGKMPVEADEIAGPPALFERLDVVPEIGQKFQIPLRIQGGKVENYDFTITGILEQTDISKLNVNETRLVYGAFVSEKFVEQHIAPEDRTYTAYIRIVNENKHSKDEIETIRKQMRKILLVDNDITFIWGLKKYLQRRGYAVETAATLAEAREMIKQEAPLLICSDLCLPDGSGLELLAEVRTCNKDTPFIIASCYEKDDYEQEALQHGVTICMDKIKSALLKDKLVEYAYKELSEEQPPTFHKLLYLHTDNSKAEVLRAAMLQKGFNLILVNSLREAKHRLLEDKEIELILCDLSLPDGTALELFHDIRRISEKFKVNNPPIKLLPFFILTASTDLATEYQYRHEGVSDYITAPVNIPELIRRILFFVE